METPSAFRGSKQFLAFQVARQDFVIEAAIVRGILPLESFVPLAVPRQCLVGVAKIGGRPVAVLDLRQKLKLPSASLNGQPRIVVIQIADQHLVGFIVDRVCEVMAFRAIEFRSGAFRGQGRPRRLVTAAQIANEDDLVKLWTAVI